MDAAAAIENTRATPVGADELRALGKRSDARGLLRLAGHLLAIAGTGALYGTAVELHASLVEQGIGALALGFTLVTMFATMHESVHRTAFKTRWMNDVVYHIACFMILREPTIWRWSHTRHHTDTIIVGRDPEIASPRPPDIAGILLNIFALKSGLRAFRLLGIHALGRLTDEEKTFVPDMERWKVTLVARIYLAIFACVIAACLATRSILPAMIIGLPSFYGGFMTIYFGLTQHVGLAEDVLDHRLNSRTVYMNPIFRFLYWNMNYHVEHHMFPMIPYHALPRLHEAVKADCPPPYPNTLVAYREIFSALRRQMRDPTYFVRRELPSSAKAVPYNHDTQIVAAE